MPRAADADGARILFDESSLDFRSLDDRTVEEGLHCLADLFSDLKRKDQAPRKCSLVYDVECLEGTPVSEFLFHTGVSAVDQDARRRLSIALDRMPDWDESDDVRPHSLDPVIEGRSDIALAPSVGYALQRSLNGSGTACAAFGPGVTKGFLRVSSTAHSHSVFFFAEAEEVKIFWRHLFTFEDIQEKSFFKFAEKAFPDLVLHHDLGFRDFEGDYRELRDRVVTILGALNDHFVTAIRDNKGLPSAVQNTLGKHGLDCSPEGSGTRASSRLMAERDVEYAGVRFRCEWHAKLEKHRNRIHFSLPAAELDDRILIGKFVRHLEV